jgi:hypothetical protein
MDFNSLVHRTPARSRRAPAKTTNTLCKGRLQFIKDETSHAGIELPPDDNDNFRCAAQASWKPGGTMTGVNVEIQPTLREKHFT